MKGMNLTNKDNIYMVGIGGAGMSALARYFHCLGKSVSGYDRVKSANSEKLEEEGISVQYQWELSRLSGIELIIYTPAISDNHEVFEFAKNSNVPIYKRSEVLGEISKNYKTIAVAGTHGKTTTSSMLAHVLWEGGIECTAFLGGIANNFQSNFIYGSSDLLIAEADEFDRSFLQLHPHIGIITSMDADHLDIYGSKEDMELAYYTFEGLIPEEGNCIVHHSLTEKSQWSRKPISYGIEEGDYCAVGIREKDFQVDFSFEYGNQALSDIRMTFVGRHNVLNMTAALSVAHVVGLPVDKFHQAASSFKGIHRRFELCYHSDRITFIDDYAHHPSEINAILSSVRSIQRNRKLIVLFQPHLYSRTLDFYSEFASSLSIADEVLLLDIYPAREEVLEGVSSNLIIDKINDVPAQLINRYQIEEELSKVISFPCTVVSLGAGDIDKEKQKIISHIKELDKE